MGLAQRMIGWVMLRDALKAPASALRLFHARHAICLTKDLGLHAKAACSLQARGITLIAEELQQLHEKRHNFNIRAAAWKDLPRA